MSVFIGGGNQLTTVMLQATDARMQLPNFQFDFSGRGVDIRPWADGMLWGRSRMGGSDSPGILLGNDFQSMGRWDVDTQDVLGGSQQKKIVGVTRDAGGTPLGSCTVQGFLTATDAYVGETTSDSGGYFCLPTQYSGAHYLVAYRSGSPDVAGTTANNIAPT